MTSYSVLIDIVSREAFLFSTVEHRCSVMLLKIVLK